VLGPLDELRVRRGAVIRFVEADDLIASIGPATRMVAISHVLWTTGRLLPLAGIADAAHAVGALLLVDGAQSAGQLDLHVGETGSDFYAISGQKWLLGPNGTGALWVHPRHHDRLRPALPSYLSYADGIVGNMRPGATRFDPGTIDLAALAGLAAAVAWVDGLEGGWQAWLTLAGERSRGLATSCRLPELPSAPRTPQEPDPVRGLAPTVRRETLASGTGVSAVRGLAQWSGVKHWHQAPVFQSPERTASRPSISASRSASLVHAPTDSRR
jgi:L-cysteine/cystine lyase